MSDTATTIAVLTILTTALAAIIALFGALYVQIRNELSNLTIKVGEGFKDVTGQVARLDEKLTSHAGSRVAH